MMVKICFEITAMTELMTTPIWTLRVMMMLRPVHGHSLFMSPVATGYNTPPWACLYFISYI